MSENSLGKKSGRSVSLNIPKGFEEYWIMFLYIISKDPKIPIVKHEKPEHRRSIAIRAFINNYIVMKAPTLLDKAGYLKFKEKYLAAQDKIENKKKKRHKEIVKSINELEEQEEKEDELGDKELIEKAIEQEETK